MDVLLSIREIDRKNQNDNKVNNNNVPGLDLMLAEEIWSTTGSTKALEIIKKHTNSENIITNINKGNLIENTFH